MQLRIENGVLWKHEKESSRLRMGGGSWTIKKEWIENPQVKKIIYETDYAIYSIDKAFAELKGFYRTLGDEEKLIVPIKNWKVEVKNANSR